MHEALDAARVPRAVRALLETLRAAGHEAWLVGGGVRDLLRGVAVADFDVATSAPAAALLALFPRAVPIGVRHGTVMIPTHAGPVDVTAFHGGSLAADLARRDFTLNAIAWDPDTGRVVDPSGGAADLAARRLRAVGCVADRFAEDPLRALRAARLVATLGLAADASIEPAMRAIRPALAGVARERMRRELEALVLGDRAADGIALLRGTGIEADLLPGAPADADRVVAALPRALPVRLAGWLRGAPAESILLRLRFPKRVAVAVAKLVALHPIDARRLASDADLRRLLRRAGDANVDALVALREAETGERLDALRERIERARKTLAQGSVDLALDGAGVMALLGCGPGPHVGAALRHLGDWVLEDPARNRRDALAEELRHWSRRETPA